MFTPRLLPHRPGGQAPEGLRRGQAVDGHHPAVLRLEPLDAALGVAHMQDVGVAPVLADDQVQGPARACGGPDAVAAADQHEVVAGGDVLKATRDLDLGKKSR